MKRVLMYISALLLISGSAAAQYDVGGLVIDPSTITAFNLFNASHSQFSQMTARSAAMAGAFTSLGGDMASMSINPAGLGMYSTNELAITPLVSFSRTKNSADDFEGNNENGFTLGNMGVIVKLRESSTGVTALNLGFGYNRIADYNYRYSYAAGGSVGGSSIADAFAAQMRGSGITSAQLSADDFNWGSIDPTYWGAALGYMTGLIGDGSGVWSRDMIGVNARPAYFTTVESSGSAGEYALSLGMNINSKIYVGATLGLTVMNLKRNIYYGESYTYDSNPGLNYRADYFNYDQSTQMKGSGVNFKLGAIYSPIKGLRIGVAVHTPTRYSLTYHYRAGMTSAVEAVNNVKDYQVDAAGYINPPFSEMTSTLIDKDDYSWDYITPTRLLLGASYTIGQRAVVSVDYERDWYNGMRVRNSPYGGKLYDEYMKDTFKGSNTLRVGVEVRVIPQVALRAGYGLWSGALQDTEAVYSSPMIYRTDYVGAGAGVAFSKNWILDVTYQYQHNKMTPYKSFYAYNEVEDMASPTYTTLLNRHTVLATLSFKF
ncbi:MAG: long-chain fatty acid transporter [Alistipes sp.]|nr:long-chain fatty acid transporter [Alistipes sp.]